MKLQEKIDKSCKTIAEISKKAKISKPTIHRILKGYPARRNTLAKLAKFFKCEVEDIKE